MNVPKKVTDFIKLDAGNIGRKSAVVTGAALAASVLGAALLSQTAEAGDHCDAHYDRCHHADHFAGASVWWRHYNNYCERHDNSHGGC